MDKLTLCCLRDHDLRLSDNPALFKAIDYANSHNYRLALCVFVADSTIDSGLTALEAARNDAITLLNESIKSIGGVLNISQATIMQSIARLSKIYQLDGVFWNRRYVPNAIAEDAQLKQYLTQHDILAMSKNSALLFEPFDTRSLKQDGSAYKVFTPFANNLLQSLTSISTPLRPPQSLSQTISLQTIDVHPYQAPLVESPKWAKRLLSHWTLSELQAAAQIERLQLNIDNYATTRNLPALDHGTSKLSPFLRLGICSAKQILHAVMTNNCGQLSKDEVTFIKEILWREYAYHMLYHFPDTLTLPFKSKFAKFPWLVPSDTDTEAYLRAWQAGQTGVPIIDAGMRELWMTGWMHNRVRMIVASWLCKNMGIHWLVGADWFMNTLIDADLASNTFGWQWVAGCGLNAAPYFRLFNPTLQAKKFDPQAKYLKKWLPALKDVPVKHCFEPWRYSEGFAPPIVDISDSRQRALAKYKLIGNYS